MHNQQQTFGLSVVVLVTLSVICGTARSVTIETVPVRNRHNQADTTGFGSVGHFYHIGKYEVTNGEYVEFLNSVDPTGANTLALYNGSMANDGRGGIVFNSFAANGSKFGIKPGRDDNPVVFVSWYDSIRFANWLHNGQGNGDTENGAYTLLGDTPTPSNGNRITRNADARWVLPSLNEWYKAAYHKNDGVSGNYWDYPTATDAVPFSDQPPGSGAPNQSNTGNFIANDSTANGYNDGFAVTGSTSYVSSRNYLTDVGAYNLSKSPYGTFDQGGNVREWNEALVADLSRGVRGGAWGDVSGFMLATFRDDLGPYGESVNLGFRVARIPEPNTLLLLTTLAIASLALRHR